MGVSSFLKFWSVKPVQHDQNDVYPKSDKDATPHFSFEVKPSLRVYLRAEIRTSLGYFRSDRVIESILYSSSI